MSRHPIGANTWIWTSPLTDERLAELAPPIRTKDLLHQLGLSATTCLVMPPGRDLVTDNRMVVIGTQEYLKGCLDMAAAIGATVVAGPAYAPVGRTWLMSADERKTTITRLVESLK